MHMVEQILNNTTPYGKIRASHEGSLHSSTLTKHLIFLNDLSIKTERHASFNITEYNDHYHSCAVNYISLIVF